MTEQRAVIPTPQKQEFVLWGSHYEDAVITCKACGYNIGYPETLDQAVALADEHEQKMHAIFDLEFEISV